MDQVAVAKLAEVLHGDAPLAPGMEELYVALDAAISSAADLYVLAQRLLPNDVSEAGFRALSELARLKLAVNPGPTEEDPF